MFLKKKLNNFFHHRYELYSKNLYDEIHATRIFTSLSSLISNWTYLPFTGWAAGPEFYAHICNDIVINQKQSIVEIGSGLSTVIIARLIKKNNIKVKFISIDHNDEWQHIVSQILESDGIKDIVEFIHSPLVRTDNYLWYDTSYLKFKETFFVDTLIVDGPPGTSPGIRYGAVPYFQKFLSKNCYTVYLHDTDRADELNISKLWANLLTNSHVTYKSRYVIFQFGINFGFDPQATR